MTFEWEIISGLSDETTQRAKVHGGWIVYVLYHYSLENSTSSMVFIPDLHHAWEVEYEG